MRPTVDSQRNGLETASVICSDIRFAFEPSNFTLYIFQDFVFEYFEQEHVAMPK